jgi:ankyrin repeat domain-containing protein 50
MALAVRGAAPLKPAIRLAQTISEFQAVLSDDQKAELRMIRAGQPPSVSDVMKVTASIDRENSRRTSRRCVGPRLINILGSVQQFSTVVDVIIGGSQNLLASAIWGTLKMTLQLTCSFATCFDELSMAFMDIGRTCPRLQEYGILYPKSVRLQNALCEYFCLIVELCKTAVLFTSKSIISQISDTIVKPFSTEFGKFQTHLSHLALAIRDESALASQQSQSLENQENAGFRSRFSRKFDRELQETIAHRNLKRKYGFLSSCSTYNHQQAWKRARKAGTSTWLFDTVAYQEWVRGLSPKVLWCTGILGAGKTVTTANLVEEITTKNPNARVGFFFCNFDEAESLKARTIVGSLTSQLLSKSEPVIFDSVEDEASYDAYQLAATCAKMLVSSEEPCFVIVDGLDECDRIELDQLFECLCILHESLKRIHIFCSSRPNIDQRYQDTLSPTQLIGLPKINAEITTYIEKELEYRLETGSLALGDPGIILKIRDALTAGGQGM